jgi:NifU-like protein involved in Fe-S cluster formation
MNGYAESVWGYFQRPVGSVGDGATEGEAGSVAQGGWIRVYVLLSEGRVQKIAFRSFACPHIIAACNRLVELLEGEPHESMLVVDMEGLSQEFEIPVEKAGKLLILKDALADCHAALMATV